MAVALLQLYGVVASPAAGRRLTGPAGPLLGSRLRQSDHPAVSAAASIAAVDLFNTITVIVRLVFM